MSKKPKKYLDLPLRRRVDRRDDDDQRDELFRAVVRLIIEVQIRPIGPESGEGDADRATAAL